MTTHDFQPETPTDATETLVRERFETAVAGLHLDVPSLIDAGTTAGRRLSRRRRLQQAGAGVVSVAVLAAGGLLGVHGGLFGSSAGGPADNGTLGQSVPSTPRALAAAVIADLPTGVRALTQGGTLLQDRTLEADLRVSNGTHAVQLSVLAAGPMALPSSCAGLGLKTCHSRTLPTGDTLVTATQGSPGLRMVLVALAGPTGGVMILESARTAVGDEAILLSNSQLVRILEDPLVGSQTSQAMVDAGNALPDFTQQSGLLGMGLRVSGRSQTVSPPRLGQVHSVPPRGPASAPRFPGSSRLNGASLSPPRRVGPGRPGGSAQTVAPPPTRRGH